MSRVAAAPLLHGRTDASSLLLHKCPDNGSLLMVDALLAPW
jgi:hypothetical protein